MILPEGYRFSLSGSILYFQPPCYKEFPLNLIKYYIIPDNKFTENKTVVYDTPGTEGTTVNTVDYLKEYQAVPKEELEQMIVFPGSEKAESSQAAD